LIRKNAGISLQQITAPSKKLGLLLAALGAQQRHHPKHFSFAIPRPRRS